MTYYGPKDLAAAFRTVRQNTIQVAEEIPEAHYGSRPAPGSRSVAETLVHIGLVTRLPKQIHIVEHLTTLDGFDFFTFIGNLAAEEQAPRSKDEILALLRAEGAEFAAILDGLSEQTLAERVAMPQGMAPASKSRFEMLMSSKEHEMHHRGQLMLVERLLGITPHLTRQMQEPIAMMRAAQAGK